jgi:hypothetical protein
MGQYTLWCLNRVAGWDRGDLVDALSIAGGWFTTRHQVRLGSRAAFDRDPEWEGRELDDGNHAGVLMHEDAACDEYFVPIAVKCVGDPEAFVARFGPALSPAGRQAFAALRERYAHYFDRQVWKAYWRPFPISSALSDVGMFTRAEGDRAYAGLYELVAADAAATSTKAIVVGYSQGGLVARFLAWMDEALMAENRRSIAGVVAVQAPNHGSPLASRANAPNVAVGLLGILTALGGFPIVERLSPHTRRALEALVAGTAPPPPTWHFDIGALCLVLEAVLKDPAAKNGKGDVFRTARKWLTGLVPTTVDAHLNAHAPRRRDDPHTVATAFDDLDPQHLDDPNTVLGCLAATPLMNVLHGAIVGTDTELDDLVLSNLDIVRRFIVRHVVPRDWFRAAELAYGHIAMDEAAAFIPTTPLHQRLAGLYQTGARIAGSDETLPPFAHDFVMPSVSQALYTLAAGSPPAAFLGNVVNKRATHISGGAEEDGDSDKKYVKAMLRDLGRQLG